MADAGYRQKCLSQKLNICNACGTGERLVVHHINGERSDNALGNLIPLCKSCHQRLHVAADLSPPLAELREELPESAIVSHDGMDTTTQICVTESVWEDLNRRKRPGDSFNDVLTRLFTGA